MFRGALAALAIVFWAVPGGAQQVTDADLSGDLKKRGDELLHASDFKGALAAYDEAYALDPNPALLYNRSRALEGMGEYVLALTALERFEHDASPELKARVPKLAALMSQQRAHISMITITSSVTGAAIVVRDQPMGTVPLAAPLRTNAGPATLEVRAAGYQTFRVSMDLPGGSLTTIDAPLLKVGETPPPPPDTRKSRSRVPSIVLAGGGVALAGVGVVLLALREGDASTLNKACPDGLCPVARQNELSSVHDRALVFGPLAAGFFIGAAVAVGVAAVAWPWGKEKASAALVLRGGALSVEGTF